MTSLTLICTYVPVTESFALKNVFQNVESRYRTTGALMSTTNTEPNPEPETALNPRDCGLALMLDDGTRKSHCK